MLTFSIFRKSDKKIVHTLRCESYSEFREYWLNQPAPQDFDYREIDPVPKSPYVFHVVKTTDGVHNPVMFTGEPERMPLTAELCAEVARLNGSMTPGEVRAALMRGTSVYTNFSRYTLE